VDQGPLLIRADASIAIGTGHAMRCLALAQAWQDAGGQVFFAMSETTPAIEERLQSEGFEVVRVDAPVGTSTDAEKTSSLAHQRGTLWVVVDGYEFGAEYQANLKIRGLKVLFTDDNGHAEYYSADFVLNQNPYASEELYRSRESSTNVLLGPRYALLRREFSIWREWKREIPSVARKILLTMGGSDPENITRRILEVMLGDSKLQGTVIVGGSNPQRRELRKLAEQHPGTVRLVENATNMPELMASADIAVAAAGSTTLEICFLGLPALLIVSAENQRANAEELDRRGAAINLGTVSEVGLNEFGEHLVNLLNSPEGRKSMSETGRKLVDGLGAERVVARLNQNGRGQNE
jgi:UDP-2,4-diacetamido-2,4,6-trideoxy-beta-L-altropyranose hydrolase